ncbi:MAG: GNAT family N-acetyltransferase [Acidimicrobiales bacterium]
MTSLRVRSCAIADQIDVRQVPAETTRPLRMAVLRPGQPPDTALYAGDDAVASAHFGAFDGDEVVGVASLYAEDRDGGPAPGWRLRGMATAPSHRGLGVGRRILNACVDFAATEGGAELWCNARLVAERFYQRAGFEIVSDEFDIAGLGPHHVMRLLLASR